MPAVGPILALLAALASAAPAAPVDCARARADYDGLALEDALLHADDVLGRDPERPLPCLEVKALSLLVLGRLDEARATFRELFARDPERTIFDPGLSPAQRGTVEEAREHARPLAASVQARWLGPDALRLDVALSGGLRGASRVRWRAELLPGGGAPSGEVVLVGRVATATASVGALEVAHVALAGEVLGAGAEVLLSFSSDLLLSERPLRPEPPIVERGGPPWYLWAGLAAAAAIGGGVAIALLAAPKLPDASGTAGRGALDP